MRKNIYFRNVIKREDIVQKILLSLFEKCASYPRLMLEVFIRKNFGERAFTVASALTVGFIIALIPVVLYNLPWTEAEGLGRFFIQYSTWYVFVGLFLYHSWLRYREIHKSTSSFDFTKFTLYSGDINPWFYKIRLLNDAPTARMIETLYEPGIFFLGGAALWICGQGIGVLICISSVFYSLSYVAAYWKGDNFILDLIDKQIFNDEVRRVYVDGMEPEDTRGVRIHAKRPSAKSLCTRIVDAMEEDDRDDAAEIK